MRSVTPSNRRSPLTVSVLIAVLLGAAVCGGCGRRVRDELPSTEATGELVSGAITTSDGTERTYHLYIPSVVGTEPMPLLIALHGGLGWGLQFRDNSGFDELAEANGFLIVYPDGTRIIDRRDNRVWNGGACCGVAEEGRRDVDDVAFLSALIDELGAAYPVDASRIYATGHSNGAIMSYRLACESADKIVAIAFQAGTIEVDSCEPDQPVSVMHLHGLADTNIPIDGGLGDGPSGHHFASPRESAEQMAALNLCTDGTEILGAENDDISGIRWSGCVDDVTVELLLVQGANHAWMGHSSTWIQEKATGESYPDLDASLAIWNFLADHQRG